MDFKAKIREFIDKELPGRYPTKRAAVLPLLHLAQKEFGYVPSEIEKVIANALDLSVSRIHEIVTFHTMYNESPVAKYHIQVCTNVSCMLLGSENLLDHLKEKLRINIGEATSDAKYTLSEVDCLGSCGTAPVLRVNDSYYENVTRRSIDMILDDLSQSS